MSVAENDLRDLDGQARRRAREVFDRPFVLEAGAGTGKTAVLVSRALTWFLGPGWSAAEASETGPAPDGRLAGRVLDGLVAITFTEKAAAEMAARAAAGLTSIAAGFAPPDLAMDELPVDWPQRARQLLAALDRLRVQTIHSFCRGLLASDPLEAGLHPRFVVDAEGEATAEVVREVLDERLRSGYASGSVELLDLARRGFGPWEIGDALAAFAEAGGRAADLDPDPMSPSRLSGLLRRVEQTAGGLALLVGAQLGETRRVEKAREVVASLGTLSALAASLPAEPGSVARLAEEALRLQPALGSRLSAWARGTLSDTEEKVLGGVKSELAARAARTRQLLRHLGEVDPELLAAGRAVVAPLLQAVEERRRQRGLVSFDELLRLAVGLLRDRPAVRRRIRSSLRQLLVDEFQDTDPLQCDLLELLALDGAREERPGLFLVGDPKQSIYGWRRADLAAYDRFISRVLAPDNGGERAVLSVNFRSVPAVLDEVERSLSSLFETEVGVQPAFARLVASEANSRRSGCTIGGRAPVEHWVSWAAEGTNAAPRPTRAAEANRIEARAIARDLVTLRDAAGRAAGGGEWRWSEVAILFRVASDQETYLEALREHAIPFQVEGDRNFFQRREVLDATSLVRAILDPGDALALVAALRSPWIGVPDAALLPLWEEQFPGRLAEVEGPDSARLPELRELVRRAARATPDVPGLDLLPDWPSALVTAIEGIARLRAAFRLLPADRFVAELRAVFPIEALSAARYLGRFRLANLTRWLWRLTEALLASRGDVDAVLRRLRRAVAEAEEDPAGALAERSDAVRILSIHKSKGLDFEYVFVPQLHHGSGGNRGSRPTFQGGDEPEYVLFGSPTLAVDEVLASKARTASAERVRLLYVAMTRARQRVVLLGAWAPHGRQRDDALLALLEHSRPSSRPEFPVPGESPGHLLDGHGVLWRCLGLDDPLLAAEGPGQDAAPVSEDPVLALELFAARRAEAARRSSRPLVGGVTATLADLEEDEEFGARRRPQVRRAGVVVAVGSAVHRFLEELSPEAPCAAERLRLGPLLERELSRRLNREDLAAATAQLGAVLDRLTSGGALLARLREIAPFVVARELPLLLAAVEEIASPVAAVVGTLDLLYRDPASDEPVVADFKTDRLDSEDEARARVAHHAPQLRTYGRAVAAALGLAAPPRLELWLLGADRIFPVAWKDGLPE